MLPTVAADDQRAHDAEHRERDRRTGSVRPTASPFATDEHHRHGRDGEESGEHHPRPPRRSRRCRAGQPQPMTTRNTSTGSSRPFTCRGPIDSQAIAGRGRHRRGGRHDLAALRLGLQPLRDVHGVADDGVLQSPAASDGPRDHGPGVHADPDAELRRHPRPIPRRSAPSAAPASRSRSGAPARRGPSVGSGAPNTTITASPWNLSIMPPRASTTSAIAERCLPTTAATSRAGSRSAIVENPRMSREQHAHLDLLRLDRRSRGAPPVDRPAVAGRTTPASCATWSAPRRRRAVA